ncbi:MAG: prefoldin subunit beta [Thermofilum sp. ex4484_15]|nr:MAG: prefoldin subunit beta [Thermofilum sp. ex4484_15]
MSTEMPQAVRNQVIRLQQMQRELQALVLRIQQFQLQLREIDNAIKELNKVSEGERVYKLSGPILVSVTAKEVLEELKSKRESLEIRLKTLEKQENLLRKHITDLEKKINKALGGQQST